MPFPEPPAAHDDRDDAERPSKTRLKQQSHDLQALGRELLELPDARLAALPMPESLLDALRELKRTRSHEGRRRQLQYVGKLMRHADAAPLREAVAAWKLPHAHQALALHQAEHWRNELLADDDALTRWLREHPDSDAQQLRSLLRAARKEGLLPPEQRHGRGYRELFQFIKSALAAHAAAQQPQDERADDDDDTDE